MTAKPDNETQGLFFGVPIRLELAGPDVSPSNLSCLTIVQLYCKQVGVSLIPSFGASIIFQNLNNGP